jgi:hypothetical protein
MQYVVVKYAKNGIMKGRKTLQNVREKAVMTKHLLRRGKL